MKDFHKKITFNSCFKGIRRWPSCHNYAVQVSFSQTLKIRILEQSIGHQPTIECSFRYVRFSTLLWCCRKIEKEIKLSFQWFMSVHESVQSKATTRQHKIHKEIIIFLGYAFPLDPVALDENMGTCKFLYCWPVPFWSKTYSLGPDRRKLEVKRQNTRKGTISENVWISETLFLTITQSNTIMKRGSKSVCQRHATKC